MDKKEYISGNLYKMTRNNAEFKPSDNESTVEQPAIVRENTVSKAQQRRLTDVYNAKLDLAARMERTLQKLIMLNDEVENIIEKRKNKKEDEELTSKIKKAKHLATTKQVKPGYKKKVKAAIDKVKRKHKREIIRQDIRKQRVERYKQEAKNNVR